MLSWLKKRLAKFRQESDRWQELAEANEELWEQEFYPEFDRAVALRSIYTADEDGQLQIVKELGGYYEQALTEGNRQMAVAMRRIEVLQKETFIPMERVLRRAGFQTSEWAPLYLMDGGTYPDDCLTASELLTMGFDVENPGLVDVALTSRGVIEVDVTDGAVDLAEIEERVLAVKPLHIVLGGYRNIYRAGCSVLTDFFTGFIAAYKLSYPFDATVLALGDGYDEYAFSSPVGVTEPFPVPFFMAFGDGGHTGGTPDPENSAATGLSNELLRVRVFANRVIDANTLEVTGQIGYSDLDGVDVSEIGLFDSFGQMLAIKHIEPRTKAAQTVMNFKVQMCNLDTL